MKHCRVPWLAVTDAYPRGSYLGDGRWLGDRESPCLSGSSSALRPSADSSGDCDNIPKR